jgi:hypothetical protein
MISVQGIALLATAAFFLQVLWLTSRHKLRDRLAFFGCSLPDWVWSLR